jgi:hypothetical protein
VSFTTAITLRLSRAPGVQTVVHRRHRQAEERGDVLLRALVHVEEGDDLAQRLGQLRDGGKDGARAPPPLDTAFRLGRLRGHPMGLGQRQGLLQALAPQHAMGLVADDAAEPAREGGRILQPGQAEPGGHEGFLHHVLRLPEIT